MLMSVYYVNVEAPEISRMDFMEYSCGSAVAFFSTWNKIQ